MKTFVCTRMRLCHYLMNKGFLPYEVKPDEKNPRYSIYLFEESPALAAAVSQYIHRDSWTARSKNYRKGEINNERHEENRPRTEPHRKDSI